MDLRFALRMLRKQPVFCLAAVLTLALGIGANSAIFSVFDAVILRPLPYRDPGRLVLVWQKRPDGRENGVSGTNYLEWVKQATSFECLEGAIFQFANVSTGGESIQVRGARVSANFISTLGVQPLLGRGFAADDAKPGSPRVVLISYNLWQTLLGGERKVVGLSIQWNGDPYTLIGVLPPGFDFVGAGVETWTPLIFQSQAELRSNKMAVLGRLKASVTATQSDREMQLIAKRLEDQFPEDNKGWSAMVTPLEDLLVGKVRAVLTALMVSVGLVLLVACANVSNLLLARSETRQKEIGIRSILGAGRAHLLRLLLTEAMLLSAVGGLAGLALAWGGLHLLVKLASGELPRIEGVGVDARVVGLTFLLTLVTTLVFGLLPARQLRTEDLQLVLRESGRGATRGRSGRKVRDLLVIFEIALSLMLAIGATLMARSLLWLEREDRGFQTQHLLSFQMSMTGPEFQSPPQKAAYFERIIEKLKSIPGVQTVGAITNPPIEGFRQIGLYFTPEGAANLNASNRPSAACNLINPDYFQASGIPIVRGRAFTMHDQEDSPYVAIISSALARRFFAGQNPIGRSLLMTSPGRGETEISRQIVGVAGDVRYLTRRTDDSIEIYLPYAQTTWPTVYVFVRTIGDPAHLAPAVRAALHTSGFRQPVSNVQTMDQWIDALNGGPRLNTWLAAIFAGIALALAAVGIYGVASYSVLLRTTEIGVRIAVGATPSDVLRLILGHALALAFTGIALGLAGYFALARVIRGLLYGTSPNDLSTVIATACLLGLIAVLACYLPARRATRCDPVTALRAE
jgi:putative ABC transport system permease protein